MSDINALCDDLTEKVKLVGVYIVKSKHSIKSEYKIILDSYKLMDWKAGVIQRVGLRNMTQKIWGKWRRKSVVGGPLSVAMYSKRLRN